MPTLGVSDRAGLDMSRTGADDFGAGALRWLQRKGLAGEIDDGESMPFVRLGYFFAIQQRLSIWNRR